MSRMQAAEEEKMSEDFAATIDGFWAHYRASGLLRNPSIKLGAA